MSTADGTAAAQLTTSAVGVVAIKMGKSSRCACRCNRTFSMTLRTESCSTSPTAEAEDRETARSVESVSWYVEKPPAPRRSATRERERRECRHVSVVPHLGPSCCRASSPDERETRLLILARAHASQAVGAMTVGRGGAAAGGSAGGGASLVGGGSCSFVVVVVVAAAAARRTRFRRVIRRGVPYAHLAFL